MVFLYPYDLSLSVEDPRFAGFDLDENVGL